MHFKSIANHLLVVKGGILGKKLGAKTKAKVTEILKTITDKFFLQTIALELDVGLVYKGAALELQVKGDSILGAYSKKDSVQTSLRRIKADPKGGIFQKYLLKHSKCLKKAVVRSDLGRPNFVRTSEEEPSPPCETMEEYETKKVMFHDIQLREDPQNDPQKKPAFKPISSYKEDYIDTMLMELDHFWPEDNYLKVSRELDQSHWPLNLATATDEDVESIIEAFRVSE